MFILFDEPEQGIHQGGAIAAPVFRKVLKETFLTIYSGETYQVNRLPDLDFSMESTSKENNEFRANRMPNFLGRSKKDVLLILLKYYQGKHDLSGSGYVLRQFPLENARIAKPYGFKLSFGFLDK